MAISAGSKSQCLRHLSTMLYDANWLPLTNRCLTLFGSFPNLLKLYIQNFGVCHFLKSICFESGNHIAASFALNLKRRQGKEKKEKKGSALLLFLS